MFIGFSADEGIEGFAFVSFVEIPIGTSIVFNDGEGTINWSNPLSVVNPGTVIIVDSTNSSSQVGSTVGTVTRAGSFNIATSNEGISAVCDTITLATIKNSVSGSPPSSPSICTNCSVSFTNGNPDIMIYNGSTTCLLDSAGACRDLIVNVLNWITDNGGGDQSQDGVAPDFPDDVPISFSIALPIQLVSFTASAQQDEVLLEWVTASESNNEGFYIEKGTSEHLWDEIGFVLGKGTSNEITSYQYRDPVVESGLMYYRLKQVDFDGQFEFSDIVVVDFEYSNQDWFHLTNTLVRNQIQWRINQDFEEGVINIFSASGQLQSTFVLDPSQALNHQTISTDLSSGLYVIQAIVDKQTKSLKFLQME